MSTSRQRERPTSPRPLNAASTTAGLRVRLADGTEALDVAAWARAYVQALLVAEHEADRDAVQEPQAA